MKLSNKAYDVLKAVAMIGAPVITFLTALCSIWSVPHCTEITATLAALDTMLGGLLVASSSAYKKEGGNE